MKSIFKMAAFCLTLACAAPMFTSCSEDSKEEVKNNADVATLKTELTVCQKLANEAATADYKQEDIDKFKAVVKVVETMLTGDPTQTQVDNALKQLTEAKTAFLKSAFDALPTDNMICSWDFDKEGTTLVSTGTQKWNAVLTAGPSEVFGTDTSTPSFVEGVKGGKALSFDNGAHLEVADYNTSTLLGSELTISVWVKPSKTVSGNYIVSLNYWHTFKFQLQENNKPFMTFASDAGIADCDNEMEMSVPNNKWSHVVVALSYKTHELSFYVNGELTKKWDTVGKPALAGTNWASWTSTTGKTLPLMIGASTTLEEWKTFNSTDATPATWDCFHGSMDQVKMFNVALTAGQVSKLYNDEK